MLLQRLATGATGVKQARYRRRPTRGSEALVRACAVSIYTACTMEGPWHLLSNVHGVYDFRRGFCTLVLSLSCVSVCLCVYLFLLQRSFISASNDTHGFLLGFSWILTRGFSKKPSVRKLWREKGNMQMS